MQEGWYTASDHPIALLRAENRLRIPWILQEIGFRFSQKIRALDIGCGAGFLTNALAQEGHRVSGIDLSENSLTVARKFDRTKTVDYRHANAYSLPFANKYYDVVCAMDVLEHVESPHLLIAEASRVLKPEGLFFFHTFNRNILSYIIVIQGVNWCVRNAPKNMHVYPLFIKPKELEHLCVAQNLQITKWLGFRPKFCTLPFFRMLLTRKVPADFAFKFSSNRATGYCGIAEKAADGL